jgi:hypothetical protein
MARSRAPRPDTLQVEQRLVGAYKLISTLPKAMTMLESIQSNRDLDFEGGMHADAAGAT